jgi:HAD superfamily hydrolase (TIGR01509 family)
MGGSEMLEALIGRADATVEDAWRRNFDELLPEILAFDGAGDLLRAIHQRGAAVVLATSSPQDLLNEMRVKVGADEAVDDVVTSADAEQAKPHPDIFEIALEKSGAPRDRTVVVGDSVWDVAAAAKARLACVAVESGGYSRGELEAAGARLVYRDPNDLCAHLDEWVA